MILKGVLGRMGDLSPLPVLEQDQIGGLRLGTRFTVADDHARAVLHPHQGIASGPRQPGLASPFRRYDVDSSVLTAIAIKRDRAPIRRPGRMVIVSIRIGQPPWSWRVKRLDVD